MRTLWRRARDVWGIIRHFLSVRSLLDLLGWKVPAVALATAIGAAFWSRVSRLTTPIQALVASSCLILVGLGALIYKIWRLTPAANSFDRASTGTPRGTNRLQDHATGSPHIVVDYSHEDRERYPQSESENNPDAPLVLRNIATTESAFNVKLLPLETETESVSFEPSLVPYIEGGGRKEVFANITDGSPLFRKRLPYFLRRTYRDTSVDELFGDKTYALRIQYDGSDSRTFETTCEWLYRRWKDRISIGRTHRRILTSRSPVQTSH
jgi:hypothetical protein